jgi:ABC-type antimicrobial peptide transport system ATPase subunit
LQGEGTLCPLIDRIKVNQNGSRCIQTPSTLSPHSFQRQATAVRHIWQHTANKDNLDDIRLLHAAQIQAREAFKSNASLAPNDPATMSAIEHAESVAKILRENVVQGKHVGDDKYSTLNASTSSLPQKCELAY